MVVRQRGGREWCGAWVFHRDHADPRPSTHLRDLLGEGLGQTAAKDGEVLAESKAHAAVDLAVAGDHTIARELLLLHTELSAPVGLQHVVLTEGVLIEEKRDALARGEAALGVLDTMERGNCEII
jgi:hypothetical protein